MILNNRKTQYLLKLNRHLGIYKLNIRYGLDFLGMLRLLGLHFAYVANTNSDIDVTSDITMLVFNY